jgi:hypothetical protein
MDLLGKKLYILGIYVISDDENVLVKEDFGGKLNEVIAEIGNSMVVLTAGEFNSKIGKNIYKQVVGPFAEEVINDNVDTLIMCVNKIH